MAKAASPKRGKTEAQKLEERLEPHTLPQPLRRTNALMMHRETDHVFEVDATPEAIEVFCKYGFRFVRWL